MKQYLMMAGVLLAGVAMGQNMPRVVRQAATREALRQDTTWTSENIRANPYLFLQDQIAACDRLRAKIEAQSITFVRMKNEAMRKAEDAESMTTRYTKFLTDAKAAYKAAKGKFPVSLNGYEMDEDELMDKIADAQDRIELAKKEKSDNSVIARKVEIRKGVLKTKKRELTSLRMRLVQQAEQVKMNAALAEIGELSDVLGTIKDMMIEIDEDPTKLTLDDLATEDPADSRRKAARSFLDK